VYSSGAGIATRLILQSLFGLRQGKSVLVIDPVIPQSLDGLRVELKLEGSRVEVSYFIRNKGYGPRRVNLNGTELAFTRGVNPYRTGGAEIPMAALRDRLREGSNRLSVCLA
jgi:cellobiose phosphorylase